MPSIFSKVGTICLHSTCWQTMPAFWSKENSTQKQCTWWPEESVRHRPPSTPHHRRNCHALLGIQPLAAPLLQL